jgi:hypothetical protein
MLLVTRNDTTILLHPSTCYICEQNPQPGEVLVDTLRNYPAGINGTGRKYVCESCVGELAGTMGLSSGVGERIAKAENAAYARAFETLRHELRTQTDKLVALVNEPLSNLDPIYGRDPVLEEVLIPKTRAAMAKKKAVEA